MSIGKMFERASVRNIVDYILFGDDAVDDGKSYEERLDETYTKIEEAVSKHEDLSDSKIMDLINELQSDTAGVYAEIGFQAGVLFMLDIKGNVEKEIADSRSKFGNAEEEDQE